MPRWPPEPRWGTLLGRDPASHPSLRKPHGKRDSLISDQDQSLEETGIYLSAYPPPPTHMLFLWGIDLVVDSGWRAPHRNSSSPVLPEPEFHLSFGGRVLPNLGTWNFLEDSVSLLGTNRAPPPITSVNPRPQMNTSPWTSSPWTSLAIVPSAEGSCSRQWLSGVIQLVTLLLKLPAPHSTRSSPAQESSSGCPRFTSGMGQHFLNTGFLAKPP